MKTIVYSFLEFFYCFCEYIGMYLLLSNFVPRKEWLKPVHIFLLIMAGSTIGYFLTTIHIYSLTNTVIAVFVMLMISTIIFKNSLKEKLSYTLFYGALLLSIDSIITLFGVLVFNIDPQQIVQFSLTRVLFALTAKTIDIIVVLWIGKFKQKITNHVPKKYWLFFLLISSFIIFSSYLLLDLIMKLPLNRTLNYVSFISLTIAFANIIFFFMFQKLSLYFTEKRELELVQIQHEHIKKQMIENHVNHQEIRKFRHDLSNHFTCLDSFLQTNRFELAKEYLQDITNNLDNISYFISTGNDVADALLNQKRIIAKQNNIKFQCNGYINESCKIDNFDLCTLLSNLLDNALEANLQVDDIQLRKIDIQIKSYKAYLLIDISNTTRVDPLPYVKKQITSKKDSKNHGIGSLSIQKVIKKYNGDIDYSYQKPIFKIAISLLVN